MRSYITNEMILDEARMIMKDYRCKYALVEGESDRKFYKLVLEDDGVYFRQVKGWKNVVDAVMLANSKSCDGIFGIIDKDYHVLLRDGMTAIPNIIITDENDLEMMLFVSPAYEKFMKVCGSEGKATEIEQCRNTIASSAADIGALRFISVRDKLLLVFDGLNLRELVDKSSLSVDKRKLVDKTCARTRSSGTPIEACNDTLLANVCAVKEQYSSNFLCNGHDVFELISISMMKMFASSDSSEHSPDRIFQSLILAYDREDFKQSNMYKSYTALFSNSKTDTLINHIAI